MSYKGESVDQYYNHSNFSTEQTDFTIIKPEDMVSFSGLGEGVQLMKEGDRYEFVLPSSLALASGRVFTFDFELLSVIQEDQEEVYNHNATLDDIEVTDSGLQYRILEEGSGNYPVPGNQVTVRYTAYYTSGYVFDQTSGNTPTPLSVPEPIRFLSDGLRYRKEGGKSQRFFLPALEYTTFLRQ